MVVLFFIRANQKFVLTRDRIKQKKFFVLHIVAKITKCFSADIHNDTPHSNRRAKIIVLFYFRDAFCVIVLDI